MISTGIDVVSIDRIERASRRRTFLDRVYSRKELDEGSATGRAQRYLAGRFALKEALIKALDAGKGSRLRMRDIEVLNGRGGVPLLRPGLQVQRFLRGRRAFLSLSFAGGLAIALAVIE